MLMKALALAIALTCSNNVHRGAHSDPKFELADGWVSGRLEYVFWEGTFRLRNLNGDKFIGSYFADKHSIAPERLLWWQPGQRVDVYYRRDNGGFFWWLVLPRCD